MPYCASCGTLTEGRFCPNCGAPVEAPPTTPATRPASSSSGGELSANVASALCYIPVLIPAIIFLVVQPYARNAEIRFHALQSLGVQILWALVYILLGGLIPVLSWRLWFAISPLINLALILLVLYLMWQTYQQRKVVLPVIGEIALKLS